MDRLFILLQANSIFILLNQSNQSLQNELLTIKANPQVNYPWNNKYFNFLPTTELFSKLSNSLRYCCSDESSWMTSDVARTEDW